MTFEVSELKGMLEARGVSRVYVAVCDLQGQLRGKAVSRAKFEAALEHGLPTPPIFAASDFTDTLFAVETSAAAGRLGDALAGIDAGTCREIPWEPAHGNLLFLSEMQGEDAQFDPRAVYRRVESRLQAPGFVPLQSIEYEFSLFNETHASLHRKEYRGLEPVTRESGLYGLWRQSAEAEFWDGLIGGMQRLGIELEACHWELSPGAVEVVTACESGVRAADNAAIFKAFTKAYAQRKGRVASFMARYSHDRAGHSGHVHVSLQDHAGTPLFHDPAAAHGMSRTFLHFIAGLQEWLSAFALMLLPNVNSFRRLAESAWSCDARYCLWSIDNRTVPLRVKQGPANDLHLEVRLPGADANPYLALAAVLGAGMLGLEQQREAGTAFSGNAFRAELAETGLRRLPRNFPEAAEWFAASKAAQEVFGAEFVRVYAQTRMAQYREFQEQVSEWELRRFLELA